MMMPTSSRRRCLAFSLALMAFAVFGIPSLHAADPSTRRPLAPLTGISVEYNNGGPIVPIVIPGDEFRVVERNLAPLVDPAIASRAIDDGSQHTVVPNVPHMRDVRLTLPLSRQAMPEAARQLRAIYGNNVEVEPIAYDPAVTNRDPQQRQSITRRLSVKLIDSADLQSILQRHNLQLVEAVTYSPDTYILQVAEDAHLLASLDAANAILASENVEFATPIIRRNATERLVPNDEFFGGQWNLLNNGSNSGNGQVGWDINVVPAWDIATGAGVNIGIVDSGTQVSHPDLSPNARADLHWNFNDGNSDPSPAAGGDHGTAVSGIAAARGNNSIGLAGVAFQAGLAGLRINGAPRGDDAEAAALGWRATTTNSSSQIHVSNNSWGPTDDGTTLSTWGPLTRAAVETGINSGRNGRGIIYVWASGNGRCSNDHMGLDGYASSRYTIAVGASGTSGVASAYSEGGSGLLVNAPSTEGTCSTFTSAIIAPLISGYTPSFNGTSASAPHVAGVVALMLQANPNLTWRDVQHILVNTARRNVPTDSGWRSNGAGRQFHHLYGFGMVNAHAAVVAAQSWVNMPAAATSLVASSSTQVAIPDNSFNGIERTLTINAPATFRTEHVEVRVNISHIYRGDIKIDLISPSGMISELIPARIADDNRNYSNWTFTSVAHWGENPSGDWRLRVADIYADYTGTLTFWEVRVHGYNEPARYQIVPKSEPSGGGSISLNPLPGQDGRYASGTSVTLTATPAPGYSFSSWSGDIGGASPTSPQIAVSMTQDRAINANFTLNQTYTLARTVIPEVGGTIQLSPQPDANSRYAPGTQVTLTAIPAQGFEFSFWGGDLAPSSPNPTSISMNTNRTVSATFRQISGGGTGLQHDLDIVVVPAGSGTVSAPPAIGGRQYENGLTVQLTAQAAAGRVFRQWAGDLTGSSTTQNILMDGPKRVIAAFALPPASGRDAFEPNNSFTDAQPLALQVPGITTFTGLVMESPAEDWYRIMLPPIGHVRFDLIFEHNLGNLQMELWDRRGASNPNSFGQRLAGSYDSTAQRSYETLSFVNVTNPHELFLRIYGEAGATNPAYTLVVTTLSIDDIHDQGLIDNNSPCPPSVIPTLALGQTYDSLVARDDDWYRVTIPQGINRLDVRVDHAFFSGDLNIMVIGDNPADCAGAFSRIIAGGYSTDASRNFEEVLNVDVSGRSSVLIRIYGSNFLMRNIYDLTLTGRP